EWIASTRRVSLDRHGRDVISLRDLELRPRRQCGVNCRVQRPAARIGLVAQRLAAERRSQIAQQRRGVGSVRLVQFEETKTAVKDVVRAGKSSLRQDRRENAGARRLT